MKLSPFPVKLLGEHGICVLVLLYSYKAGGEKNEHAGEGPNRKIKRATEALSGSGTRQHLAVTMSTHGSRAQCKSNAADDILIRLIDHEVTCRDT